MREIGEMRAEDGREGPVSMTVGGLCEEWLRSVKPMVKPSTYACYLTMVEKHIRGELGKVQAAENTARLPPFEWPPTQTEPAAREAIFDR